MFKERNLHVEKLPALGCVLITSPTRQSYYQLSSRVLF